MIEKHAVRLKPDFSAAISTKIIKEVENMRVKAK